MIKSNLFWICVLGGIAVSSAIVAFALWLSPDAVRPASLARIFQDGKHFTEVILLDVSESFTIVVDVGEGGGFNVIEVEHGRVRMLEANCANGTCLQRGWVSGGLPIICLPNRVVIEFSGTTSNVDAVVG